MAGFEGMDDLINDLKGLSEKMIPEVARPSLKITGKAAVELAKASAPEWTGRFRRSIHVGGQTEGQSDWNPGADRNWYEDLGAEPESKDKAAIAVGSTLWYGVWAEFGGAKNPATYAVGNAVEAVDPVMVDALEFHLEKLLREAGW